MAAPSRISANTANAVFAAAEAAAAKAPKSVLSIPSVIRHGPVAISDLKSPSGKTPGAAIVQVGGTRRVYLINPYLNTEEMNGLAYRIHKLSKNTSINSILLGNNHQSPFSNEEPDSQDILLPSSLVELETKETLLDDLNMDIKNDIHLAGGYDARALATASKDTKRATLNALIKLTNAVNGGGEDGAASKIPFITVSHGLLNDGGYALGMGSYVMTTTGSRFRIMNPMRGLSLDPIGFSYILPRLGMEYSQPSAKYPVGSILALTGYEADGCDMVETGLATHNMESYSKLAMLERSLAQMKPYEQQAVIKEPVKRYDDGNGAPQAGFGDRYGNRNQMRRQPSDINGRFRNVSVSLLLNAASAYDAMGQDHSNYTPGLVETTFDMDPSLTLESEKPEIYGFRQSMLLNIAATFQEVFEQEKSVAGIMERMKQFASAEPQNEEEIEFVEAAKDLLDGMEAQSPIALLATHRLMKSGKDSKETLQSCMEREMTVQLKLFEGDDFQNWAKSGAEAGEFKDWKHKTVNDVTSDEIEELFG